MSSKNPQPCLQSGCAQIGTHPDYSRCDLHKIEGWRTGRNKRLPSDWQSRRKVILARDGFKCQSCKVSPATEVDHIKRGDDHSYDNLQSLCAECHRKKTFEEAMNAKMELKTKQSGSYWAEEYWRRKNNGN